MTEEMSEEIRKEAAEHRDVILDIRAMLISQSGQKFLKYLFKHLDVGEVAEMGMEGNLLHDRLGFLRAGNSIYKLIAEADFEFAGMTLAQIEKERYERLSEQTKRR